MEKGIGELRWNPVYFDEKNDGPDAIRTHDLPVISRVHHRLCYGPQQDYPTISAIIALNCFGVHPKRYVENR